MSADIYYLNGYVRIKAESDADAVRLLEEAGLGCEVELTPGVVVDFQGPWDEVEEVVDKDCTCPPDIVARGGFTSTCQKCK